MHEAMTAKMEIFKNSEQWNKALSDPSLKNILNLAACYQQLDYKNIAQKLGAEVIHYEISNDTVTSQTSIPTDYFLTFPIIIASSAIPKTKYCHLSTVGLVKSKYFTNAIQNDAIRIYIPFQDGDKEFYYTKSQNTGESKEIALLTQEFDRNVKLLADKMANENASLNKEYMEIQSKMRLKINEKRSAKCECCQTEFDLGDCCIEEAKPICKICAENAVTKHDNFEKYYKSIALHNLLRNNNEKPLYSKNTNDFTSE
jgi:hypothetical protein